MRIILRTIPRARTRRSHSQKQQIHPRQLSRLMFYDSSFVFHNYSVSIEVYTPLQPSPPILFYIRGSHECNFFRKTFPWQLISVRYSQLLSCKIFVLKYFRRTSTLRKFFNTKIFPTKIYITKISQFTVHDILVARDRTDTHISHLYLPHLHTSHTSTSHTSTHLTPPPPTHRQLLIHSAKNIGSINLVKQIGVLQ